MTNHKHLGYEFIDAQETKDLQTIMTVRMNYETKPTFFKWLLGHKPKQEHETFQVIGSCTVWSFYPSFQRIGDYSLTITLMQFHDKAKHFGEIAGEPGDRDSFKDKWYNKGEIV